MSVIPGSGQLSLGTIRSYYYPGSTSQVSLNSLKNDTYGMSSVNVKNSNFYSLSCRILKATPDTLYWNYGEVGTLYTKTVSVNCIPDITFSVLSAISFGGVLFDYNVNNTTNTISFYPKNSGYGYSNITIGASDSYGNFVSEVIRCELPVTPQQKGNGFLYNGYAVNNSGFAPTDWDIPTDTQISTLSSFAGGSSEAGGKLKEPGLEHWNTPNPTTVPNYPFNMYGSGNRQSDGSFFNIKDFGYFWVQGNKSAGFVYSNTLLVSSSSISDKWGYSVRLIYTGTGTPGSTISDIDGNTYDVVQIGSQYWTAQNWKSTRFNTGGSITDVRSNGTWAAASTGNYYRCAYDNLSINI